MFLSAPIKSLAQCYASYLSNLQEYLWTGEVTMQVKRDVLLNKRAHVLVLSLHIISHALLYVFPL